MENERRYRRRKSDVKEDNMESSEQEPRTVRHEYGSSSAGDSIGQARRVIDELEARINDARRVPMSKTLSIIDTGELIDLIGQLRIVLPHTVVPDAFAGKGVGSALAVTALSYARDHGMKVLPRCPFIAGYIKKHPEWHSLVHDTFKARLELG